MPEEALSEGMCSSRRHRKGKSNQMGHVSGTSKKETRIAMAHQHSGRSRKRRLVLAVGGVVAALTLAACGSSSKAAAPSTSTSSSTSSSTTSSSTKHYHFELITKSNASPYWLAVKAGADAAAKKLGDTVSFEAPASGTDLSEQISMFNDAVTSHVSGIILAAQQPTPLAGPVEKAIKAGIPVVTVDSGVSPPVSDSFEATSNIKAGAQICEYGAKLAGGKGEYGIIDFNEISSTGRERPEGCKDGMKKFPNFKFIGMQISNNSIAKGKAEAEAMLEAHPHINLMFGANDRAALGAAEAVQALHKVSTVTVVGFDADLGEVPLIREGVIKASQLQSPYTMGYLAVENLVKIKEGKSVPKRIDTPTMIVTPKTVDTTKAKEFLAQYGAAKGVKPTLAS
jgi:ribose transport system substrate-binding protein